MSDIYVEIPPVVDTCAGPVERLRFMVIVGQHLPHRDEPWTLPDLVQVYNRVTCPDMPEYHAPGLPLLIAVAVGAGLLLALAKGGRR